jgi:hypothetical protein
MKEPPSKKENPKADKSPSLDATNAAPQSPEPLSPSGTRGFPIPVKTPKPVVVEKVPTMEETSSPSAAGATPGPNSAESPKKTTP